jgi:glycosyltransferase involved in cell wall biosynthesis
VPGRIEKPVPKFSLPEYEGKQLLIYQGALNVGRGLELMIETMHFLDNVIFLIVGKGDIERELKARVDQLGLSQKIHFKGRMTPNDLAPLTAACDLGVSLEEDLGLNYRYALPNKLFDYIQARIPVLCSALPEMARIVETYGVGVATRERQPEQLAAIIRYMLKERSQGAWLDALEKAAEELCWESEAEIYRDLLIQAGALQ